MSDERKQQNQSEQADEYEPPRVEDVPAEDGPAVTAAGKTPQDISVPGPEWRPLASTEEDEEGRPGSTR
jgi:hypothetical protein